MLFHGLGECYEERSSIDKGTHMKTMAAAMGKLRSLAPSLAGPPLCEPPLPFNGPQPLPESWEDVLSGDALTGHALARTAVNQYWSEAIAAASFVMKESLAKLTAAVTPSWKDHLEPGITWLALCDSCDAALVNVDGDSIMASYNQAKKASSGICRETVPDLNP